MGQFGDKFRQAREKKNLSLDDVSNVTKISSRMLQAIEEEHFDLLPGGVFNKGFIRAYSKHLGLDAEEAVTEYLLCLREAQIGAHQVWDTVRPDPAPPAPPDKSRPAGSHKAAVKPEPAVQVEELPDLQLPRVQDVRPPRKNFAGSPESGIPWTLIAAAAFVIVLAIFLWTRHSRSIQAAKTSTAAVTASNITPAASTLAPASTAKTNSPASAQPSPAPPAQPAPKTSHSVLPTPASQTPANATDESSDVTVRSFPASNPKPAEKPSLTLVIRASETSWISVQSDGQLVAQETLIAPAVTSFHASRELVVRIGNAAGVSFLWNGEELPPQGAESEAKTFVFDAKGMRSPASDQTPH